MYQAVSPILVLGLRLKGRILAYHVGSPSFNPWYCQEIKKKNTKVIILLINKTAGALSHGATHKLYLSKKKWTRAKLKFTSLCFLKGDVCSVLGERVPYKHLPINAPQTPAVNGPAFSHYSFRTPLHFVYKRCTTAPGQNQLYEFI